MLFERLRVRRIYYHSHEGGRRRKKIIGDRPSTRSFRERFGFAATFEPPRFRAPSRKARRGRAEEVQPPW